MLFQQKKDHKSEDCDRLFVYGTLQHGQSRNYILRGLKFEISNHGDFTAKNIEYTVEINKYNLLGMKTRTLYQKSDTISSITSGSYQKIEIRTIKRAFCKINPVCGRRLLWQ